MVASVRQKYETVSLLQQLFSVSMYVVMQHQSVVEPMLDSIEEIVGRAEETLYRLCTATTSSEQQQLHIILQVHACSDIVPSCIIQLVCLRISSVSITICSMLSVLVTQHWIESVTLQQRLD